uniref:Uncharacterized protein n=1 Tax=Cacopsylla melanoneura TaxID=428564 RepID=A0A8D9FCF4_9HEMI
MLVKKDLVDIDKSFCNNKISFSFIMCLMQILFYEFDAPDLVLKDLIANDCHNGHPRSSLAFLNAIVNLPFDFFSERTIMTKVKKKKKTQPRQYPERSCQTATE